VNGSEISKEHFDKPGRVQLRGLVRSSARILANLEIVDSGPDLIGWTGW
jgi:hypothetical protein